MICIQKAKGLLAVSSRSLIFLLLMTNEQRLQEVASSGTFAEFSFVNSPAANPLSAGNTIAVSDLPDANPISAPRPPPLATCTQHNSNIEFENLGRLAGRGMKG